MDKSSKINIKKNSYGFRTIYPKPNKKILNKYYQKKYFNTNKSYKDKLLSSEKNYLKCIHSVNIFVLKKFIKNLKKCSLLDLGAGKGTFVFNVQKNFRSCLGVDFAKANLGKEYKSNINFISENPEIFIKKNLKKFNVITLNNVLEHVTNPVNFLKTLRQNIAKNTLLLITIPNDFSMLQKTTNKKIKNKNYWISYPEHLNYFNKQNFIKFSKKMGFDILDAFSDFPIELFLLKKEFDYTHDTSIGKKIHLLRCEIFSFLYKKKSLSLIYKFFKILYDIDIGRDYTYLLKKK